MVSMYVYMYIAWVLVMYVNNCGMNKSSMYIKWFSIIYDALFQWLIIYSYISNTYKYVRVYIYTSNIISMYSE